MASQLYLSSTGSDSNPGTLSQPMLTVDGVLARARSSLQMSTAEILFLDRGTGIFRATTPVVLRPSDSGVTFRGLGAPGFAKIRGSRPITGWVDQGGGIYRAPISTGDAPFFTIFEDGVRGRPARSPKLAPGASYPASFAPYRTSLGVNGSHTQIEYGVGEYDPTGWDVRQAQVCVWSGAGINWFLDLIRLVAVNIPSRLLGFGPDSRYGINSGPAGSRYFVQNVLSLLTEPGEFATTETHVYYMFRGDPLAALVEAPAAYDIFTLRGSSADRVQDVTFDGLTIEHTDMVSWYRHAHVNDGEGYTDRGRGPLDTLATSDPYDRQMTLLQNRHGLISLFNCDGIQVVRCHLNGAGLHGIYAGGTERAFNKNHNISDTWISDTGHSGIYADGDYPGGGDVSRDWTISDVKVTDVGRIVGNGAGMIFINSGHHTVSHCAFERGPRNGFFVGAYTDIPSGSCYSSGILLEYTRFLNFCQDSGDVGVIGLGGLSSINGGPVLTNTLSQVIVDGANAHPSMQDVYPNGIFTDNQSWYQVFQNVRVLNTQGNQFRINDSGGHTYTNTSFQSDGTPNPSFNPAAMSSSIGLTASFPF